MASPTATRSSHHPAGFNPSIGLNYDDRVPGIAFPTGGTPAAVKFNEQTSYYAGGGPAG